MCNFISFCIDKKEHIYIEDMFSHDEIYKKYKGNIENLIEVEWTDNKRLDIRTNDDKELESFLRSSIIGRWKTRNDFIQYIYDNKLVNNIEKLESINNKLYCYSIVEYSSGTKEWYKDGVLHRDNDLPAIEYSSGTKKWYKDGVLHRDNDLPAIEYSDGTKEWYKDGVLHRDNDLPAIEHSSGTKKWYKDGKYL
jgi:hypothetical protein